jgi:hypothetical protein
MEAIQKALEAFSSHDVESQHNQEMAAGADAVLLKHFIFVSHMQAVEMKDEQVVSTEMAYTVQAMELVYRSSSSMVHASFKRMGDTILRVVLDGMDREIARRKPLEMNWEQQQQQKNDDESERGRYNTNTNNIMQMDVVDDSPHDATLFLQHTTKLLGHFARVGDIIQTLAHFPKCLDVLMRLCQPPYHVIPWQARLSALWTLANLACHAENMQLLVTHEGMVETLVKVACRPLYKSDQSIHTLEHIMEVMRSRNIASRAILNLSWAPENKITLADNVVLLDLIAELCVHRQAPLPSSHTVSGILLSTRRHAAGALRNLAAAPKRIKVHLCEYKQGHVLDVLTDAALNDPDVQVKERAFAAIHNLANMDTAEKIVNHPALVLALRDVLLSTSTTSSGEEATIKRHASSTILVLKRTITPEMDAYENLRDLLQAINPAPVGSDMGDEPTSSKSSVSGDEEMRVLHTTAV